MRGRKPIFGLVGLVVLAAAYRLWWQYGSVETKITAGERCQDFRPSYSPDGKSILFTRFRRIYIMDASGRNLRRVGNFPGSQDAPCWSPDGKSIAFVSSESGAFNIWTSTVDGKQSRNLTRQRETTAFPAWSPDATKILFTRVSPLGSSIGCVSLATGRSVLLNPRDKSCRAASWSPDGKKIAYVSWKIGPRQIWVMDADGKNAHQIVFHPGHTDDVPSWSHDGRSIVFTCNKNGPRNLWIVPSTGGEPRPLTHHTEGHDLTPSFHPGDTKVIYARSEGDNCEVRAVRIASMQDKTH